MPHRGVAVSSGGPGKRLGQESKMIVIALYEAIPRQT